METFIHWCGFFGGWFLVAGPLYQAQIELRNENFSREEFYQMFRELPPPKPISRWWLLLPPLHMYLSYLNSRRYQEQAFLELSAAQRLRIVSFMNKANGWRLVGVGATLVAATETWHLVEFYRWPLWVFWAIVILVPIASGINAAYVVSAGQKQIEGGAEASGLAD